MATPAEIVSKMVAALRRTDPELDSSIGTPTRKILDAVGESVGEAYLDNHLMGYQYDIDTKIGADLDQFVSLFGFARLPKQRATGVVVFTRGMDAASKENAYIPAGTQVVALLNPSPVFVQTVLPASMGYDQLSVDVPVQAIEGGSAGNVPAETLTNLITQTTGISAVINPSGLTGGADQESDEQLRARFKATVFRSLAGTEQMYVGLAFEVPGLGDEAGSRAVSKVNVVGVTKTHVEQVQVVGGTATTTLPDAAYIYPNPCFVGYVNTPENDDDAPYIWLTQDAEFTWTVNNTASPATGTLTSKTVGGSPGLPDGFYDLTFEYMAKASRNDPAKGIGNRVDIYVNGSKPVEAVQTVIFPTASSATQFNDTVADERLYRQRYVRKETLGTPAVGNLFIPLAFSPIVALPDSISVIDGTTTTTYVEGTDYWLVERKDALGGMSTSLTGIEWLGSRAVIAGKVIGVNYSYNSVVREVDERIADWRLLGTDARAHQGKEMPLRFNLVVMYHRNFAPATVNSDINAALARFVNGVGFRSTIQVSDVLHEVSSVPGVDNVRFATVHDHATVYAMQHMVGPAIHHTIHFEGHVTDAIFGDDEIPVFHSTTILPRAANTFLPLGVA